MIYKLHSNNRNKKYDYNLKKIARYLIQIGSLSFQRKINRIISIVNKIFKISILDCSTKKIINEL
jgi:hypothetical protein